MSKGISLYIHIPYCKRKCLYCDFPSFAHKEDSMLDYTKALCKEIEQKVKQNIRTIFIGGGTPTYLSLECFELLKESLDRLNKDEDLEFTIECNPESLTKEKLEFFKGMGVNRLSIGLQAWQDKLLKKLGRVHSLEGFLRSFKEARAEGFNNINVDIMFGLPDQDLVDWQETLREVVKLEPEHLSCYSLIVEEYTPFYELDEKGRLMLPEEEEERKMYETAVEFLKEKGYRQYEVSNFSKPDYECRHNLTYWSMDSYIGCGSGAASYMGGIRYKNIEDIEKYIEGTSNNIDYYNEKIVNTKEDNMEEFMFMGLRKLNGISKADFRNRFGEEVENIYGNIIKKFQVSGLLSVSEDRIFLTAKGIELSNQVMCEFIL